MIASLGLLPLQQCFKRTRTPHAETSYSARTQIVDAGAILLKLAIGPVEERKGSFPLVLEGEEEQKDQRMGQNRATYEDPPQQMCRRQPLSPQSKFTLSWPLQIRNSSTTNPTRHAAPQLHLNRSLTPLLSSALLGTLRALVKGREDWRSG